MQLQKLLNKAVSELKGVSIPTAELDVRILLEHALSKDDVYLISHSRDLITNSQYSKFRRYIRRRKSGEPVTYIVGHKEFYGLDFKVNKNVLIPRPETELLVEAALQYLQTRNYKLATRNLKVIDIGTGSSCIIISLIKSLETRNYKLETKFYASDISKKALAVAKFNAKKHSINNCIKFYHSDLFSNPKLPKKFDLIIANLPYLKPDYKDLDFEPRSALDGGRDGLEIVKRLINILPDKLVDGGIALLEIDHRQFDKVKKLVQKLSGLNIEHIRDIGNWDGAIKIIRQ